VYISVDLLRPRLVECSLEVDLGMTTQRACANQRTVAVISQAITWWIVCSATVRWHIDPLASWKTPKCTISQQIVILSKKRCRDPVSLKKWFFGLILRTSDWCVLKCKSFYEQVFCGKTSTKWFTKQLRVLTAWYSLLTVVIREPQPILVHSPVLSFF